MYMSYEVARLESSLVAVAVFDDAWGSYNNVYALQGHEGVTLIDSGKAEHAHMLVRALTQLDIQPKDVSKVLLTHGHNDHVGGLSAFGLATILAHPLEEKGIKQYSSVKVVESLDNLPQEFVTFQVGNHSKGSVVYYHSSTKALFSGDFLTFFAEPVAPGNLVTEGLDLRKKTRDVLRRWLHSPAIHTRGNPDGFRQSLEQMAALDVEYLCTGHGPILKGNISSFLRELSKL